jgi:hypothetical protein
VSSVEDRVHAAMSAAADLAAQEIPTAPPLRLPAEPEAGPRRRHVPRRWTRWAAPLAAAATVVALAISLVLIKGVQNASVVPSNGATSNSAGPDAVPRYYVALQRFPKNNGGVAPADIVVGDALTGQTLATFAPPAHANFWSVSAAADNRTFVVEALTPANSGEAPLLWPNRGAGTITASWFEVHLAPGTANPVRLTSLPIKPQSWVSPSSFHDRYDPATAGVISSAVSESGRELAVLDVPAGGREEVKVFSLATGQLLHDWTTDNSSVRVPVQWAINTSPLQALTWIDDDRAIAVAAVTSIQIAASTGNESGEGTLRSLRVAGPASGDLLADSTPSWSGHLPETAPLTSCFGIDSWPEQISPDGKTVSCAQGDKSHIAFVTDPLTGRGTAKIDYQVRTSPGAYTGVLWTNPSGDTLIAVWGTYFSLGQPVSLHFGVISHGMFMPLRLPSSITSANLPGESFSIAF